MKNGIFLFVLFITFSACSNNKGEVSCICNSDAYSIIGRKFKKEALPDDITSGAITGGTINRLTDSINILHERLYGYKRPMLRNDRYDDDRNYLKKQICSYTNAFGTEYCGNLKKTAKINWFLGFKRKAEIQIELISCNLIDDNGANLPNYRGRYIYSADHLFRVSLVNSEEGKVSTTVNGKSLISSCSKFEISKPNVKDL